MNAAPVQDIATARRRSRSRSWHADGAPKIGDADPGPGRQHANGRLEVATIPDPKGAATIRRAQVRDPVKGAVRAWARQPGKAPYRLWLAAERFRLDLARASAEGVGLRSQLGGDGGGGGDPRSVNYVAAQQRAAKAWQAIGLSLSPVISWCVVPKSVDSGRTYGTLDDYDTCRGWRNGKAAEQLEMALHRLADHYDLGRPEMPRGFV